MYKEFTYYKHRNNKTGVYWKCTRRTSTRCPASVTINHDGMIVKLNEIHNHEPKRYVCSQNGVYIKV